MTGFCRSLASLAFSNSIIVCGVLFLGIASSGYAFSPSIANVRRSQFGSFTWPSSKLNQVPAPLWLRPRHTALWLSNINVPRTALEILEMKQLVLSISSERDDERRRRYVLKWITHQTEREDYHRGVKMLHLWENTVTEAGEEFQQRLRGKGQQNSKPCSTKLNIEEEKKKNELSLWAFVDMLVQTKTLLHKLKVPRQSDGKHKLCNVRTYRKLDGNDEEDAFQ